MITPSFSLTATERVLPKLALDFTTANLDPRVTFTRTGGIATVINSSGSVASVAADIPRFDYDPTTLVCKGLLIEESRTNSIRNNTMVGAVTGSPGTAPTNWIISTIAGLTREIVAIGVDSGINYIDVKFSGTATVAGAIDIFFEPASGIVASTGQTWAFSLYWKLQAGSTTGLSSPQLRGYEYTAAIGFIRSATFATPSFPTTASLITQRLTGSATLAGGATTAFVRPLLAINVANGATVDVTFRIGLPQFELGAFSTSVIPTSVAQVTRTADVATMTGTNFSSWFNAAQGTFYAEAMQPVIFAASRVVASASDGTTNTRITQYRQSAGGINSIIFPGGATFVAGINATANVTWKQMFGYTPTDANSSVNGVLGTVSGYTIPSASVNVFTIGSGWTGSTDFLCGYVRKIMYYPIKLTNAELVAFTKL